MGGGYDGVLRLYGAVDCGTVASVQAHDGPIKALAVAPPMGDTGGEVMLTGGKDRVLRAWRLSGGKRLAPRGTLVGHENSLEAVAVRKGGHQVLSGDWGGMVFLWRLPGEEQGEGEEKAPAKKKRKGSKGGEEVAAGSVVQEAGPLVRLKAHTQCVSDVAWDATAEEKGTFCCCVCVARYGMDGVWCLHGCCLDDASPTFLFPPFITSHLTNHHHHHLHHNVSLHRLVGPRRQGLGPRAAGLPPDAEREQGRHLPGSKQRGAASRRRPPRRPRAPVGFEGGKRGDRAGAAGAGPLWVVGHRCGLAAGAGGGRAGLGVA